MRGTYLRIVPRDLFNESALLGAIGKLVIALETAGNANARIEPDHAARFTIVQDDSSGSISVDELRLLNGNQRFLLERPLNTRTRWMLHCISESNPDEDATTVFTEDGVLTDEMKRLVGAI